MITPSLCSNDEDLPPPLEDMSDFLKTRPTRRVDKVKKSFVTNKHSLQNSGETVQKNEFNGLKKGFLNQPTVKKPNAKPADVIPYIKHNNKSTRLEIPEVRNAMESEIQKLIKTPEFLSNVESSSSLRTAMGDPLFAKAAEEMGRDPSSIARYANSHPQWINALREFSGLMGNVLDPSFQQLGKEEKQFLSSVLENEKVKVYNCINVIIECLERS